MTKFSIFTAIFCSMFSTTGFAGDKEYQVLEKPAEIKVQDEYSNIQVYTINQNIRAVSVWKSNIRLRYGYPTLCMSPYLGKLVTEANFKFKNGDQVVTAKIDPKAEGQTVKVYGECGNGSNELNKVTFVGDEDFEVSGLEEEPKKPTPTIPPPNLCTTEALLSARALAKVNGADGAALATRAMVAGNPLGNGSFSYVHTFHPIDASGNHLINALITVDTVFSVNGTCSVRGINIGTN